MRYLVWFALPCCAALFCSCYLPAWWLAWPLALVAAALVLLLRRWEFTHRTAAQLVAAGAAFGFLWFGLFNFWNVVPVRQWEGETEPFTASVASYPEESDYGVSLTLRMENGPAQGKLVLVYLDSWYDTLEPGDQLTGTITLADAGHYQSGTSTNYYLSQGIFWTGDVEVTSVYHATGVSLRDVPARLGHWFKAQVDRFYTGDAAALLLGLITGDKTRLSTLQYTSFQRAGIAHLLAVSGLHISFLTGLLYLIPGNRTRRFFLAVPTIALFALMTGGKPSALRAVIMSTLLLMAPLFHRKADGPTSLAVALLLLLLQNPYASQSVSLQLSFAAVAGLVCCQGRLYHWMMRPVAPLSRNHGFLRLPYRLWQLLASSLSVSCAALVFTLPMTAWYFQRISLIGPVTNLLCVWPASLAFSLGLLGCCLGGLLPSVGELFALPVTSLLHWINGVAQKLGSFSFSCLRLDNFYLTLWLIFAVAVLALLLLVQPLRKRPILPICSVTALLLLALTLRMLSLSGVPLCVTALDVGTGNCTVFSSDATYVAVDCGGDDAGDLLADYVQSGGANQLSLLVITDYQSDCIDGVEELLQRIPVDTIALPDTWTDREARETLTQLAMAQSCQILWVDQTQRITFGQAELTIYVPVEQVAEESETTSGLAVQVDWQTHHILVAGTLDTAQEQLLLERETLPKLDVLVVANHGSGSSTGISLLSQLSPKCALIAVGSGRFRTPSDAVLTRLAGIDCDVYRTDLSGSVTIRYQQ